VEKGENVWGKVMGTGGEGSSRKGREMKMGGKGKGRAGGAFPQIKIYDYTPECWMLST